MLICISFAILVKKEIYYKYIDAARKMTSFDHIGKYDGNWLFKDIGFNKLLMENPDDQWLAKSIKDVKKLEKATVVLFLIIIVFAGVMKYLEVV